MRHFNTVLDGTPRKPRPEQVEYLDHLQSTWDQFKVHAGVLPTGVGKSLISRTIQRSIPGAILVTPNNNLVSQYTASYPELTAVIGRDNYATVKEYSAARKAVVAGGEAIFNPVSYYYYQLKQKEKTHPPVVIVDEAHQLANMLLLTVSKQFSCKAYGIPLGLNDASFLKWLSDMSAKLTGVLALNVTNEKQSKLQAQAESLYLLWDYLKANLSTVKITYENVADWKGVKTPHLVVRPLVLPRNLLKTIFGDAKFVLMSGTLTDFDLSEIFPEEKVDKYRVDSLVSTETCPIINDPMPRGDIGGWARKIVELWENHNKPNTLVHVTYGESEKLRNAIRGLRPNAPVYTHDKETKTTTLTMFKERGGILLGSGMAEGVDLPGDFCRLLIIPKLIYANLGDDAVQKRLAMPDGQTWYSLTTMMTTVQMLGRGVRGADDSCVSYILDPLLPKLLNETKSELLPGFLARLKIVSK